MPRAVVFALFFVLHGCRHTEAAAASESVEAKAAAESAPRLDDWRRCEKDGDCVLEKFGKSAFCGVPIHHASAEAFREYALAEPGSPQITQALACYAIPELACRAGVCVEIHQPAAPKG